MRWPSLEALHLSLWVESFSSNFNRRILCNSPAASAGSERKTLSVKSNENTSGIRDREKVSRQMDEVNIYVWGGDGFVREVTLPPDPRGRLSQPKVICDQANLI